MNLIIGIHSIKAAIDNPKRSGFQLFLTDDAKKDLQGYLDRCEKTFLKPHELQEKAKEFYKKMGMDYTRIPSGAFLVCEPLPEYTPTDIWELLAKSENETIICLDGVTDVHNAGAIMRTASFFGVKAMVTSAKGTFGQSPSFFRIASGATEDVMLVKCASLPKFLNKLKEHNVLVVGLSEHASDRFDNIQQNNKICLVFGSEDKGMSNAVSRVVDETVALEPLGATQSRIKSLNVSVAAAVTLEKFAGNS